MHLQLNRNIF